MDAAAAAAAPAAPKVKITVKRSIAQPTTIQAYWRARNKRPDLFTYTESGDLKAPATKDLPEKIFPLPSYRPATRDEIEADWAERQEQFDKIYEDIEKAKELLRVAHQVYREGTGTEREVVTANQAVAAEEAKLVLARSPLRWIDETYTNPTTSAIDLQNKYEVRKLGFPVYVAKRFGLTLEFQIRIMDEAEEAAAAAIRAGQVAPVDVPHLVKKDSVLGLIYPKDITVGGTKYYTPYMAIFGEIAKQTANQELLASLLGTRSVRTVRNLVKDFTIQQIPEDVLERVTDAAAAQFPNFRETLLKTGDKTIAYASNLDNIFSTGLDETFPDVQWKERWTGMNLWGKALETARTRFREQGVSGAEPVPVVTAGQQGGSVITEDEQKAKKIAAIIAARRH